MIPVVAPHNRVIYIIGLSGHTYSPIAFRNALTTCHSRIES